MSQFDLRINTDNSTFDENKASELAKVLRDVASQVEAHAAKINGPLDYRMRIKDANGNTIGNALVQQM